MAKRHFEGEQHAKEYAKFRPSPPDSLIKYVISKTKKNDLALDIGCGSGQMTKLLAPFFKKAKKYSFSFISKINLGFPPNFYIYIH